MAKKPVAVLVENGRSMGMNLSQLNEKGNGREKKKKEKKGGLKPSLKIEKKGGVKPHVPTCILLDFLKRGTYYM